MGKFVSKLSKPLKWYYKGFRWLAFYDNSIEMSNTQVFIHAGLTAIIVGIVAVAL